MANEIKNELTNPETAKLWKHTGNWNRIIHIPGVWRGHVTDISPEAVRKLLEQGRTDFVPIDKAASKATKEG